MSKGEAVNQRKAKQCGAVNEVAGEGRAGPPPSCHSLPLKGNGEGLHGDGPLSLLQIKQQQEDRHSSSTEHKRSRNLRHIQANRAKEVF